MAALHARDSGRPGANLPAAGRGGEPVTAGWKCRVAVLGGARASRHALAKGMDFAPRTAPPVSMAWRGTLGGGGTLMKASCATRSRLAAGAVVLLFATARHA